MVIKLPDLKDYRTRLINKGAKYPLKTIEAPGTGLLGRLPAAPPAKTGWIWTEETDPSIYNNRLSWPKLTIVTPSYNQGQFIEETIRSVLLQNYPNLEYIVMDGGSTDDTKSILDQYSPWISYWQSEKDNGQSQAINQGFSLATGDYFAWINSDDYYLKGVFFSVIGKFIKTNTSFVYGYGLNLNAQNGKFELFKMPPLLDYFIRFPALVQPSCFWSAAIHQPLWEELHCSLDFELWQRIVKGNKKQLIKQPLSVANIHADAKSSDPKMDAAWVKDHGLICHKDAYGPVHKWRVISFLYRVYIAIHNLKQKITAGKPDYN